MKIFKSKKWKIVGLVIVFILLYGSFKIIDTGHTGVVKTLGKVDEKIVRGEGLNLKIPFFQNIIEIDNRIQKTEVKASAASKDLQTVTSEVAVNYNVNKNASSRLYKSVGMEFSSKIIDPAIQESIKAVTAKYTAEQLITKRDEVSTKILETLNKKIKSYGLDIKLVNLRNFTFSETFTEAVEAKQTAEQQALKSKRDLERIKIEAEQKIAKAKAEAQSLKLQKQEITSDLLELRKIENQTKAIEKWNGNVPQTVLGGQDNNSNIIFSVPTP